MPGRFRSVIEEHLFAVRVEELMPDARRADEYLEAVKFLLARSPESGIAVRPNSPVFAIPAADVMAVAQVIVYYCYDDDYVYLLDIRLTDYEE